MRRRYRGKSQCSARAPNKRCFFSKAVSVPYRLGIFLVILALSWIGCIGHRKLAFQIALLGCPFSHLAPVSPSLCFLFRIRDAFVKCFLIFEPMLVARVLDIALIAFSHLLFDFVVGYIGSV